MTTETTYIAWDAAAPCGPAPYEYTAAELADRKPVDRNGDYVEDDVGAAHLYVYDGNYLVPEENGGRTYFVAVAVAELEPRHADMDTDDIDLEELDETLVLVPVDPKVPDCAPGQDGHLWESPHAVVGGLEENPGVRGNGAGLLVTEVCTRCGWARVTDTNMEDRTTGRQGLNGLRYHRELADAALDHPRYHLSLTLPGVRRETDALDIDELVQAVETVEYDLDDDQVIALAVGEGISFYDGRVAVDRVR